MSQTITIFGAEWCADCHEAKALLDENGIQYEYRDVDNDPAAMSEMLALVDGKNVLPTIVIGDTILQEPSHDELKKAVGLSQESNPDSAGEGNKAIPRHEVIVVGAGPAALTAAIYTTREDIETLLFERGVVGGLAAVTDKIDNYPGFPDGVAGLTLADDLRKQAERFGAVIELGEVTGLEDQGEYKLLKTTSGDMLARAVLVATGSDYKKIGVPGELEYYGRGVHYCATCDGAFYRSKKLAVVGGGNSAVQESIFLTRFTSHIDLLVRSTIKASDVLKKELQTYVDSGKITVHLGTTPDEILGKDKFVTGIKVTKDGTQSTIELDGVFVFVGLDPNSQFLQTTPIILDAQGFVTTDEHLMTAMPGVFACGDIRSGATMQIASAAGEGATSALKIREYLEGRTHAVQN